MKIEDTDVLGR